MKRRRIAPNGLRTNFTTLHEAESGRDRRELFVLEANRPNLKRSRIASKASRGSTLTRSLLFGAVCGSVGVF